MTWRRSPLLLRGFRGGTPSVVGAAPSVRRGDLRLPKFDYYLDESDPDIPILRRQDGSFVAAFSARGATREGIVEAAEEDYRELLRRDATRNLGNDTEDHRSA
jgi:hypothetical protein